MHLNKFLTVSTIAFTIAGSAMVDNVLRWTSQGDALTMDPHSQNESPTIAMNGQMWVSNKLMHPFLRLFGWGFRGRKMCLKFCGKRPHKM